MRLLNTETRALEEFFNTATPKYAILSHTWGDEEVSFLDFHGPHLHNMKNYTTKVVNACERARRDGLPYIWIDTCCIDKSSSAELSEAINSMYRWYADAKVCYAYLSDLPGGCPVLTDRAGVFGTSTEKEWVSKFAACKWFTRGWTLQELIAPKRVIFFDQKWDLIGEREMLLRTISKITKVETAVLSNKVPISSVSIAKKMSWAAERNTSRLEDQAYSLLGIFEVYMPMLYGEGKGAFIRLQSEIMRNSTDDSILAWKNDSSKGSRSYEAFAESPADFKTSYNIVRHRERGYTDSFEITNKGLRITIPVMQHPTEPRYYLGVLNCGFEDRHTQQCAVKLLKKGEDVYIVMREHDVVEKTDVFDGHLPEPRTIFLLTQGALSRHFNRFYAPTKTYCLRLSTCNETKKQDFEVVDTYPIELWNTDKTVLTVLNIMPDKLAAVLLRYNDMLVVVFVDCTNSYNSPVWIFRYTGSELEGESAWHRDWAQKGYVRSPELNLTSTELVKAKVCRVGAVPNVFDLSVSMTRLQSPKSSPQSLVDNRRGLSPAFPLLDKPIRET